MPFTKNEFLAVFARYNEAVWPMQAAWLALALFTLWYAVRGRRHAARVTYAVLGILWIWMGAVYHAVFFRPINPAATLFAALFLLEGALLLLAAADRTPHELRFERDRVGIVGLIIIAYALVLYPAIGYLTGRRFPLNPTFGLPCPTTLFTFGMLMWARPRRLRLLMIPAAWAALGVVAALRMGVFEDAVLPVAAVLAFTVRRRQNTPARPGTRTAESAATAGTAVPMG